MTDLINQSLNDESIRKAQFPVLEESSFLAHAGVAALPQAARSALIDYADYASRKGQEDEFIWKRIAEARARAASLIDAKPSEIALLGPTALGLNLVANGWPWEPDDEVVYYQDDYPANVYPWLALKERGVKPVPLAPERMGEITWKTVESVLTPATRMVALASCHYLTGYRIDIDDIGRRLHERNVLFCLDGIQTLGAFPTSVKHVDFLSADSHKWMLGPVGAGLFYVREALHEQLQPTLLGAWNVFSPEFVAQDRVAFYNGARRYEPGSLNIPGILAMDASLEMLQEAGIPFIAERIRALADTLSGALRERGFETPSCMTDAEDKHRSGIVSVSHPVRDLSGIYERLTDAGVRLSMRRARNETPFLRFSPHVYNTQSDLDRALVAIDSV